MVKCNYTYWKYALVFLLSLNRLSVYAQLSPGDLAESHKELEGMFKCTECHVLGEKVSNEKCLNCHKTLQNRVQQKLGYHASVEVKDKDCAECHSDHNGRKFEMIRFEKSTFKHDLTGYELEGAHQKVDCRDCHKPDFIEDKSILKYEKTYLGLNADCLSCHEDQHQGTLSNKCMECHDMNAFEPATNFDHSKTDYPLNGKHEVVDCAKCHISDQRNGRDFQIFQGVEFGSCSSCHADVHNKQLGSRCTDCHRENSFQDHRNLLGFNHNRTSFKLKGAHGKIKCKSCHNLNLPASSVLQDLEGTTENNCVSCHQDVHLGKFGLNCTQCHNENDFLTLKNKENFNHELTDFTLEGLHQYVDCKKCHKQRYSEPIPHDNCASCHVDYHESQFVTAGKTHDCSECHTVFSFEETTYTIADHQKSNFVLRGSHLATPCFACHLEDEKWSFRNIGMECQDCHLDVHDGYLNDRFYPEKQCDHCHTEALWKSVKFDHSQTNFSLEGIHLEIRCTDCHVSDESGRKEGKVALSQISSECISCHENIHGDQFEKDGVTKCTDCHAFKDWYPILFDHDQTQFRLDGEHKNVDCNKCHIPDIKNGKKITNFKIEKFECIDCHL